MKHNEMLLLSEQELKVLFSLKHCVTKLAQSVRRLLQIPGTFEWVKKPKKDYPELQAKTAMLSKKTWNLEVQEK